LQPVGRATGVVVSGAERTTLWPLVEDTAKRFGLIIKPDPRPEQGSFYRSDHFSFAHAGIPSFSIHESNEFAGKPANYGAEVFQSSTRSITTSHPMNTKTVGISRDSKRWRNSASLSGSTRPTCAPCPPGTGATEFLPAREKSLGSR
jgi:Zn-dependent M28 family amino/carboxypeptidase